MEFSQSRQRFYQEINQNPIDLGKAALCIALEEYPELDIDHYSQRLDHHAAEVAKNLPQER
ncbi:MAG: hypothetical protein ACQERW_14160, partial [Cyanobacteriota bacterium]